MRTRNTWIRLAIFSSLAVRIVVPLCVDTEWLQDRIEAATPPTSFRRLKEGLFLFQNGASVYDGASFAQPPLFLLLFQILSTLPEICTTFLFATVDALTAYFLADLAVSKRKMLSGEEWTPPALPASNVTVSRDEGDVSSLDSASRKRELELPDPSLISLIFLSNPFSIATCLSRSQISFSNLFLSVALSGSAKGNPFVAMAGLAGASYLTLYPVLLFAPCLLMVLSATGRKEGFGPIFAQLRSWAFLSSVYGSIIGVPDLRPNIGLWWYFFIEIFSDFRTFFLAVFQLQIAIFALPIALKWRYQPMFAAYMVAATIAIFKSYPTIGDVAFYISLLSIHVEVFDYMRNLFLVGNLFFCSVVLGPVFHYLWVWAGSANSNFLYAITLLFNLAQIILVIDSGHAQLRREFDRAHGGYRGFAVQHRSG